MADKSLVVPVSSELVTEAVVDRAYEFYHGLAEEAAEGMVFSNAEEREAELARIILQLAETADTVNDNVRQRAVNTIARYRLYHHTPEGWDDLQTMLRDACPSLSASQVCEHLAIADTVAPWCEKRGIALDIPPGRLGYLREAASALRSVIKGPATDDQKKATITEELQWLSKEAPSRQKVRDRYRDWRGDPARGASAEKNEVVTIVLRATPLTAAAIRQKLSRMVVWDLPGELLVRTEQGTMVPSKLGNGQFVQDYAMVVSLSRTIIIDGETGEVVE